MTKAPEQLRNVCYCGENVFCYPVMQIAEHTVQKNPINQRYYCLKILRYDPYMIISIVIPYKYENDRFHQSISDSQYSTTFMPLKSGLHVFPDSVEMRSYLNHMTKQRCILYLRTTCLCEVYRIHI